MSEVESVNIYIGFSLFYRSKDVRKLVRHLEDRSKLLFKINCWMDDYQIQDANDRYEMMQTVNHADVAVVFFSKFYVEDNACSSELDYIKQTKKLLIIVSMDESEANSHRPEEIINWLPSNENLIDKAVEISGKIEELVTNNISSIKMARNVWLVNFPEPQSSCSSNESLIRQIADKLTRICKGPKSGCLLVIGDKDDLFACQLFHSKLVQDGLSNAGVQTAVYLNCRHWGSNPPVDVEELVSVLLKMARSLYRRLETLNSLKKLKPVLCFVNVSNFQLAKGIFENFCQNGIPCCVTMANQVCSSIEDNTGLFDICIIEKDPLSFSPSAEVMETGKIASSDVEELLEEASRHLHDISGLCHELPLNAKLMAGVLYVSSINPKLLEPIVSDLINISRTSISQQSKQSATLNYLFKSLFSFLGPEIKKIYRLFILFEPKTSLTLSEFVYLVQDNRQRVAAMLFHLKQLGFCDEVKTESFNEPSFTIHDALFQCLTEQFDNFHKFRWDFLDDIARQLLAVKVTQAAPCDIILGALLKMVSDSKSSLVEKIIKSLKDRAFGCHPSENECENGDWLRNFEVQLQSSENITLTMLLVESGEIGLLKRLIHCRKDVLSFVTTSEEVPLMFAAAAGGLAIVKYLIVQDPSAISRKNGNGSTALAIAAENGHLDVVKFLHEQDKNVIAVKNQLGEYPLMAACNEGHFQTAKYLHEQNSSIVLKSSIFKITTLMFAAQSGNLELVKYIYSQNNAAASKANLQGETALMLAVQAGRLDIAKFLHEQDTSVIAQVSKNGETALIFAVRSGDLSLVKFIHQQNGNVISHASPDGKTAAIIACECGYSDIAEYLYEVQGGSLLKGSKSYNNEVFVAAFSGSLRLVEEAVEKMQDPEAILAEDERGNTALMNAVQSGNIDVVKYLVEQDSSLLGIQSASGEFPLTKAATRFRLDVVEYIHKADESVILLVNDMKQTVLLAVVHRGNENLQLVKYLHEQNGKAISQRDVNGLTPFLEACSFGCLPIVKFLYEQDTSQLSKTDNYGNTALIKAVESSNLDLVKFVHRRDSSLILLKNKLGQSSLLRAVERNCIDIAMYLLEEDYGDLVSATDREGKTVLMAAVESKNLELFKIIYQENPQMASKIDSSGINALMTACSIRNLPMVQFLHDSDDKLISQVDSSMETTLMKAVSGGSLEIVKFIHEKNANLIMLNNSDGESPLLRSCLDGCGLQMVEYLYQLHPPAASIIDDDGQTVLMKAAKVHKTDVIAFLHERDPSLLSLADVCGYTALSFAVESGSFETAKYLVDQDGSLMFSVTESGQTPLMLAAAGGSVELVEFLYGQNPSSVVEVDSIGRTAFMMAVLAGNFEIVEFLLERYPSAISRADTDGQTNLMMAVMADQVDLARFLLEHDRNTLTQTDSDGRTVLSVAIECGCFECVKLFCEQETVFVKNQLALRDSVLQTALDGASEDIINCLKEHFPDS